MRPFVALAFIVGSAYSAPTAGVIAGHALAGHAVAAPVAVAHAAPVAVAAPAVSVPAPYSTESQAAGVTTFHQPATPFLPISVSPYLKGTHSVNAPIVKTQTKVHTVNEPVYVERRVEVPYDVPVYKEQIVKVPTPVHVDT